MNIDEIDVDDVLIYREDGFQYVEEKTNFIKR